MLSLAGEWNQPHNDWRLEPEFTVLSLTIKNILHRIFELIPGDEGES